MLTTLPGVSFAGRETLHRRFWRCGSGAAAIEFALIIPVLTLLLFGSVELSGGVTAAYRAGNVAQSVAQLVSQAKTTITVDEMAGYIKSAALIDPDIGQFAKETRTTLANAVNVTVSSIAFKRTDPTCTQNCDYTANVVFSEALAGPKRACGVLTKGNGDSPTTLPPELYGATSIVAVDVELFYRPILTNFLGQQISFRRHAYLNPRSVSLVNYVNNCSGYPS